ncbi:hypothetical protein MTO96_002946 [Rhipicephalus appendiculatus]
MFPVDSQRAKTDRRRRQSLLLFPDPPPPPSSGYAGAADRWRGRRRGERRAAMASWPFPGGRRRAGARRGSPSMAGPAELLVAALLALCAPRCCLGNPDAKRLYDDLMSSYNRLIRPVSNNSDRLTVRMGLKLSQLIDVEWSDHKLKWDPQEYGGVTELYVPAEQIWLPDIVLYNK